jgi:hypothetical protein
MKKGHRMLADLTVTPDEPKPATFSPTRSVDARNRPSVETRRPVSKEWMAEGFGLHAHTDHPAPTCDGQGRERTR